MSVGLNAITMGSGETAPAQSNVLGKDDFLTLLVTQLRHQDPLNPTDSAEFTAQLAQFSSLEQLENINGNLEYLQLFQSSINNSQAVSFIGKDIDAVGNSLQVNDGVADDLNFELAANVDAVFINIYDSSGSMVKTIEKGPLSSGRQSFKWDCTDSAGDTIGDGAYTFEALAVDADGGTINVKSFTSGKVTSVNFKNGAAYLVVGNLEIPVGDIIRVSSDS